MAKLYHSLAYTQGTGYPASQILAQPYSLMLYPLYQENGDILQLMNGTLIL